MVWCEIKNHRLVVIYCLNNFTRRNSLIHSEKETIPNWGIYVMLAMGAGFACPAPYSSSCSCYPFPSCPFHSPHMLPFPAHTQLPCFNTSMEAIDNCSLLEYGLSLSHGECQRVNLKEFNSFLLNTVLALAIWSRTLLFMVGIGERMKRQNESAKKSDLIW